MITAKTKSTEERMSEICNKLGFPFKVVWLPDQSMNDHGKIDLKNRVIQIFDLKEDDAWSTLVHEILELKLRPLLSFYRNLVNLLIEVLEKLAYKQKESFLEELPETMRVLFNEMEKGEGT